MERHYRYSPICRPAEAPAPQKKRRHDRIPGSTIFQARMLSLIIEEIVKAHFDLHMDGAQLSHMLSAIILVASTTVSFIRSSAASAAEACDCVETVLKNLPSARACLDKGTEKYLRVEPLAYKGVSQKDKAGAVFFSIFQVIVVLLQESKTARVHSIKSSERWKTGELYQRRPKTSSDVIHGRAFYTRREICGKASADESRDLRIALHGWTDEYTATDGLGTVATNHKYGVFLAALLNLPLEIRHHFSFILLLCMYRAMYAKEHGGFVRMLTGVGQVCLPHTRA